jgi:hypothetical protein
MFGIGGGVGLVISGVLVDNLGIDSIFWLGVVASLAGLIAMFRNVTLAVAPVAEVNNYLLPLWMIVFGVGLMRFRGAEV